MTSACVSQIFLGALGRLVRVPDEQSLVKEFRRRQRWFVAEQDVEEGELRTCRPSTTRQTVSGVTSSSPIGPHSQVQNTAAAMTARGESPVLDP